MATPAHPQGKKAEKARAMSGETEKNISGWSVDTLKEFLLALISETKASLVAADAAADVRNEQRFVAQQLAVKDALLNAEKAVLVAEANSEKWRGNANEWRGAMNDRERTLMPRTEAEAATKANADKIDALAARMDAGDRTNAESIKQLTAAIDKAAGRREGLMIIFAVVAAIATVISVVGALR